MIFEEKGKNIYTKQKNIETCPNYASSKIKNKMAVDSFTHFPIIN